MLRETLKILLGRFGNYLTHMVIEQPSTKITNLIFEKHAQDLYALNKSSSETTTATQQQKQN